MKKAKKQCLGFFGLSLVVAMTVIAANLPSPKALAVSTTVTDITVRVVGSVPDVNILGITSGEAYVDAERDFSVDYENVETMTVSLDYTDIDGNVKTTVLDELTPDYIAGAETYKLQLSDDDYGYGKYVINTKGIGYDGVYDEDSILFYYLPVSATVNVDDVTGKHYVNLDYAADDGTSGAGEVAKIVVNVYDESGKLVTELSPIEILPPAVKVELPFEAKKLPSGTYTIKVSSYDKSGNELYQPYVTTVVYREAVVPDAGDTGGLFKNLTTSREDYLISGLIVFFTLGTIAFGIIARNKKADSKKRRK